VKQVLAYYSAQRVRCPALFPNVFAWSFEVLPHAFAQEIALRQLRKAMAAVEQPRPFVPVYSVTTSKSAKTVSDGHLLEVLPFLGSTLGLQGLACLAAAAG
jgi:hypothetical protein